MLGQLVAEVAGVGRFEQDVERSAHQVLRSSPERAHGGAGVGDGAVGVEGEQHITGGGEHRGELGVTTSQVSQHVVALDEVGDGLSDRAKEADLVWRPLAADVALLHADAEHAQGAPTGAQRDDDLALPGRPEHVGALLPPLVRLIDDAPHDDGALVEGRSPRPEPVGLGDGAGHLVDADGGPRRRGAEVAARLLDEVDDAAVDIEQFADTLHELVEVVGVKRGRRMALQRPIGELAGQLVHGHPPFQLASVAADRDPVRHPATAVEHGAVGDLAREGGTVGARCASRP